MTKKTEIAKWIDEYQKGKSGIYPYQVALEVAAIFKIPMTSAQKAVMSHIKKEVEKCA